MARDLASSTSASPEGGRPAEQTASGGVELKPSLDSSRSSSKVKVETWPSTHDVEDSLLKANVTCPICAPANASIPVAIGSSSGSTTATSSTTIAPATTPDSLNVTATCEAAAIKLERFARQQGAPGGCGDDCITVARKTGARRMLTLSPFHEEVTHPDRIRLVNALARVLTQLANLGQYRPQVKTGFHAVKTPALDIGEYLARISHYYFCSDSCLVLGLVYIDRLLKMHPEFVVSPLSIHRLIATSMTVAVKFFDDDFFANAYYARVAGVRAHELNTLEARFLQLLQWKLHVPTEEYDSYRGHLDSVLRSLQADASQDTTGANSTRCPSRLDTTGANSTEPCKTLLSSPAPPATTTPRPVAGVPAAHTRISAAATPARTIRPPASMRPQPAFRSNAWFGKPV